MQALCVLRRTPLHTALLYRSWNACVCHVCMRFKAPGTCSAQPPLSQTTMVCDLSYQFAERNFQSPPASGSQWMDHNETAATLHVPGTCSAQQPPLSQGAMMVTFQRANSRGLVLQHTYCAFTVWGGREPMGCSRVVAVCSYTMMVDLCPLLFGD